MKIRPIFLGGACVVFVASLIWSGCGNDNHGGANTATIRGNVSSVTPAQARRNDVRSRWLARLDSLVVREAVAQSSCPATRVLICANNGTDDTLCTPVDSTTCDFTLSIDTRGSFAAGSVAFLDDVDGDGSPDTGEPVAVLTNSLVPLCNGTVVTLNDVTMNFTTMLATAASVEKDPDTCAGTPTATPRSTSTPTPHGTSTPTPHGTSTPTPHGTSTPTPNGTATATPNGTTTPTVTPPPGGTSTPTRTATPSPTTTPTTYGYGISLNTPPSNMFALLSGLGVVGLLLPRRRRRRD